MKINNFLLLVFSPLLMHAQPTQKSDFTAQEIELIQSGTAEDPMRVLLTTNEDDLAFLTQQAQPINPNSENLQLLADRMLTTVNDPKTRGVGIAAPQVGISRQAFLVKRLDKINAPFELFINPKITWYSDVKRYGQEGCLSIPDQTGKVYRSLVIQIEYCDLEGNEHKEVIEGYTAVICQHEYDHLNGVLFLDQIERSEGFNYAKSETKNALYYELLPPTP